MQLKGFLLQNSGFFDSVYMLCGAGGGRDGAGTTLVGLPRNSCGRTSQEPLLLLNSMLAVVI